jgi:hypothetical protein
MSMQPSSIREENGRYVVDNARPKGMRTVIKIAAPLAIAFVLLSIVGDVQAHHWIMIPFRLIFALVIGTAAMFSLFGAESVAVEGGDLVWRRGDSQERRAAIGDVERLEREGNHLRVHVRGETHPIVVGAGLRQSPEAMQWLAEQLDARLTAARTGTRRR